MTSDLASKIDIVRASVRLERKVVQENYFLKSMRATEHEVTSIWERQCMQGTRNRAVLLQYEFLSDLLKQGWLIYVRRSLNRGEQTLIRANYSPIAPTSKIGIGRIETCKEKTTNNWVLGTGVCSKIK